MPYVGLCAERKTSKSVVASADHGMKNSIYRLDDSVQSQSTPSLKLENMNKIKTCFTALSDSWAILGRSEWAWFRHSV